MDQRSAAPCLANSRSSRGSVSEFSLSSSSGLSSCKISAAFSELARRVTMPRIGHAALERREQLVDVPGLVAEARDEGALNVEGESRLAPALDRQAADETKAPGAGLEELLEVERRGEERVHLNARAGADAGA